jgi:protein tyrosine phosphatase (PTP) superfamily phosphohydrolase (DUF442 family)
MSIPNFVKTLGVTVLTFIGPSAIAAPAWTIHISNFARVNDSYYRGGQPEGRDYQELAALGIRTVIDLKHDGAVESAVVRETGMRFYSIPMTTASAPSLAAVQQFLSLVNDPANQPVYVHCQGGRDRTGLMTAIYRVTHDGWPVVRAYSEMKQYGYPSAVAGGHALRRFLYDFAKHSAAEITPA